MKLYFSLIGGGLILIAILNIILGTISPLLCLAWVIALAICCGLIDGFTTLFIHLMPRKLFHPEKRFFNVSKRKLGLYKKLGVQKWKEKVPELGQFAHFKKNKIAQPRNIKYMRKYLIENCYADMIHLFSGFLGFLILLIAPNNLTYSMALPIAILNFIINYMPVMIQRYNRPKLMSIYNRLQETEIIENDYEMQKEAVN